MFGVFSGAAWVNVGLGGGTFLSTNHRNVWPMESLAHHGLLALTLEMSVVFNLRPPSPACPIRTGRLLPPGITKEKLGKPENPDGGRTGLPTPVWHRCRSDHLLPLGQTPSTSPTEGGCEAFPCGGFGRGRGSERERWCDGCGSMAAVSFNV